MGFEAIGPAAGDVIWVDEDRWVAPILAVGEPLGGMPLDEAFGRAATRHLRGGDDPEPTLALTRGLAGLVARLHVALATPSQQLSDPVRVVSDEDATFMLRAARDAVSEAVTLTRCGYPAACAVSPQRDARGVPSAL